MNRRWQPPTDWNTIQNFYDDNHTIRDCVKKFGGKMAHYTRAGREGSFKVRSKGIRTTLIDLKEVLVENSTYTRHSLKKRLIQKNILQNRCYECGLSIIWNNKPIVMVIDHINGINNDNRLNNLRLLCPNCDSQQPTFCGRNIKHKQRPYSVGICTTNSKLVGHEFDSL